MSFTKEEIESMNRTDIAVDWLSNNPEKQEKIVAYTLTLFDGLTQFQTESRERTMGAILKDLLDNGGKAGSTAVMFNSPYTEFERDCVLKIYPEENSEEQIHSNVGSLRMHSFGLNCEW